MDPAAILEEGEKVIKILQVNEERQLAVELCTRGQTCNPRWFDERNRRITCSNFGVICHRRAPPGPLVKTLLYSVHSLNSPPLVWGRDHEAVAVQQYIDQTQRVVVPCGLFVDLDKGFLAGSPDGLVGETMALEVKCPYKWRHQTPLEACMDKSFYAEVGPDTPSSVTLKKKSNYYYQVSIDSN